MNKFSLLTGYSIEAADLINQMPGYLLWKNQNSVYIAGSATTARLLGFKDPASLNGLTDYDIRCKAADDAKAFIEHDKLALKSSTLITTITVHSYAKNEIKTIMARKARLKDKSHNLIGISCYCFDINRRFLKNTLISLSQFDRKQGLKKNGSKVFFDNYLLTSGYPDVNLTKRQAECLFYLIRGKSAPSIAKILSISSRTVETYIDEIKIKFGVSNKSELIEICINRNYADLIPDNLIYKLSDVFKY